MNADQPESPDVPQENQPADVPRSRQQSAQSTERLRHDYFRRAMREPESLPASERRTYFP